MKEIILLYTVLLLSTLTIGQACTTHSSRSTKAISNLCDGQYCDTTISQYCQYTCCSDNICAGECPTDPNDVNPHKRLIKILVLSCGALLIVLFVTCCYCCCCKKKANVDPA